LYLAFLSTAAFGQTNTYPYYIKSFAGTFPLGDGGPATSALLYFPVAAIPDAAGNLYILDTNNYAIRKVTPDGKIASIGQMSGYDMKLGPDGNLYVAGSSRIYKINPANGQYTVIAGTGTSGYGGDEGPATQAQIGNANGLALDSSGKIYFTDQYSNGNRVRMITTDGNIHTIAGTASYGFNGNGQPATSTTLYYPEGIAVDASGNIYVADRSNHRVRMFTVGGAMATIAGTGVSGKPVDGPATSSPLGNVQGLWVDSSNNLYVTDTTYGVVLKIAHETMTHVAGNFSSYGSPGDGIALGVNLLNPPSVSADASGSLYIPDNTHVVRKLTSDGQLTTVAGKPHFGGDGGPAVSALLNEPVDVALDSQGNVLIADYDNYRIRKVLPNGTIGTYSGNGIPGNPPAGTAVGSAQLPSIMFMTTDSKGAIYLASYYQIFKVTPDGTISPIAGTGAYGSLGDGGPALAATMSVGGMAVDASGNIYVADVAGNRVRMISAATGNIGPFAGSGTSGSTGDGGLATSAQLRLSTSGIDALAVDSKGDVYIADAGSYSVWMVDLSGIIHRVIGNGTYGSPGTGLATSSAFSAAASMAFDGAGNLYIASAMYGAIYRYQPSDKTIRRITGNACQTPVDGGLALNVCFSAQGIKVDQNGDIYAADWFENVVWRLVANSPSVLTITDGNNQTAKAGQSLPKALKVQLSGRALLGVPGIAVSFAVTSGSATLSTASTVTDSTGLAGIGVTLGASAGNVTITATAVGTGLPPLVFTETATPLCDVPQPVVTSAASAGDFGGSLTFAPGSWLEIKGTNLAQTTRQWTYADFTGSNAPTSLDGVYVTINGKNAYPDYISPVQINVQAPADTATGAVQLVVTTAACASAAFTVQEAAIAPALLAPASFKVNGTQYLVAQFGDLTYVGNPNLIPGTLRPAAPGDVIIAYGIGFGPVTPAILPGVIASGTSTIPNLTVSFGSTPATVKSSGLTSGYLGLYQINLVVPNVPNGDYPVVFQAGSAVGQTAYLTVHK
jgi:uncharacterized protein (TIGR03437 family)